MLEKVRGSLFLRLLVTFFLVGTCAFAVEAWVVILVGRGAIDRLEVEILVRSAQDVLGEVHRHLWDRCGEVQSWSRLDVMDEILIQDRFLNIENLILALKRERPENYLSLTVLDRAGTIVASSDVNRIGERVDPLTLPGRQVPDTQVRMSDYPVEREDPRSSLLLAHPIISRLNPDPIGWFLAEVSWQPVERIVAGAVQGRGAQDPDKAFLLVDAGDRILAGDRAVVDHLSPAIASSGRLLSMGAPDDALMQVDDYLFAGYGGAAGGGAVTRGLRVVALWREKAALAVERLFVLAVVASTGLGLALLVGASFMTTRGISRRLSRLIEGTGRLGRGELAYRVDEGDKDEFGHLARSFNAMASELARARDGLEAAVTRWRAILTHAPDLIMTVDREGTILFLSRVLSGFSLEKVVGTTIYDYVLQEYHEALRAALDRVFRTGEAAGLDLEGAGADGTSAWYSTRIGPVERDGQVEAATVIITDITPRKRLEREILEVSELERNRIGRDLHDGLGQVLTGIALLAKGLEQKLGVQGLGEATEAMQIRLLLADALKQTRTLAKGLFPVDLGKDGLRGTLEELATNVEQMFGVACSVEGPEVALRDRSKATHLFRIAQEAISNSLRHSRARTIVIRLESNGDHSFLSIMDDGIGLSHTPPEREGMGLRSMRYRAGVIGATLDIKRMPEGGTVVVCRFPWSSGD